MTSPIGVPVNHAMMKLGKLPPKHDPKTLHLANYLIGPKRVLPKPPIDRDWNAKLPEDLGMFANDRYGDCGFAGMAHAEQTWGSNTGAEFKITEEIVLKWYSECTGFDPNDPSTDNGVVLLDALNYFRKIGLIKGFTKVNNHDLVETQTAINLFGGTYIGAQLPISAQTQATWTGHHGRLTGDNVPGSWGGHCLWAPTFTPKLVPLVTWGARKPTDWQWWLNYVDEAYAVFGNSWLDANKVAPVGLDLDALLEDLAAL